MTLTHENMTHYLFVQFAKFCAGRGFDTGAWDQSHQDIFNSPVGHQMN
jgi:hypothetical protein